MALKSRTDFTNGGISFLARRINFPSLKKTLDTLKRGFSSNNQGQMLSRGSTNFEVKMSNPSNERNCW